MSPRGRKPTAAGAELASAVLSDLAAKPPLSRAAIAARHGISRQRVQAIARAAGLPRGGSGGGAQPSHREGAALMARVRELAAAAGEEPGDWLTDAAEALDAVETIAARVNAAIERGLHMPAHPLVEELFELAVGRNPPELAAQVRAAMEGP